VLLNVAIIQVELARFQRDRELVAVPITAARGTKTPHEGNRGFQAPFYKAHGAVRLRVNRWTYPTPRIELVGLESKHPTPPGTNIVQRFGDAEHVRGRFVSEPDLL